VVVVVVVVVVVLVLVLVLVVVLVVVAVVDAVARPALPSLIDKKSTSSAIVATVEVETDEANTGVAAAATLTNSVIEDNWVLGAAAGFGFGI
jgi:hypothetical protein